MRTLVLSDFHLGLGPRHAVLELPRPRARLLEALDGVDRLVLLGDVLELIVRPAGAALSAARPILTAIGATLAPGAEVVFVPGNHDHALVAGWLRHRREPLGLDTPVPRDASPALARVCDWLGRARVHVHYPGVWLEDRVWAMHGHYLDHHLLPYSSYGLARGLLRRAPSDTVTPDGYEPHGRVRSRGLRSRLPAVLREPLAELLDLARAASMPLAPGKVLSPRIAPLTAIMLGVQLRHAGLPAVARVVHRLAVPADTVLFGHVHRLGPLAADDPAVWREIAADGGPRFLNSGSWVYEPLLLHRASAPHPYWPGGALEGDGGEWRPLGLLDDFLTSDLHAPGPRPFSRTR